MDGYLAWMIVVAAWSISLMIVFLKLEFDTAVWTVWCVLVVDILFFLVYLTVGFLRYSQAWPFIPQ